ncbi:ABC transporter substrate-binding protein [Micromonospora sp. NBC_01699]|uniref:ABC transporter substrate-binding protein n=1 Tax=Micromonospora sp. NBC_01699 TaxID=2975984 RepID=UPI002E2D2848|nr:ABC transporter substrate-binding protein [Micromonospora sp. NBC_01699]
MRRARLIRVMCAAGLSLALVACGGSDKAAGPASGGATPVTIKDCAGNNVTFAAVPQRVVVLDGYAAQSMVRLGLGNRIVGVGFTKPFSVEQGPIRSELSRLPVLTADSVPPTELVAAKRPDLVLTAFSAFGGAPGSPKDADLATMNALGLAACMPRAASPTEAAEPLTTLAPTYDYLLNIGKVFRVEDRAEQLVADLKEREQAVVATAGTGTKPRVLILPDNPVAGQPVPTSGPATIANALVIGAGGENVFADASGMHSQVSPEKVAERDPQVILVVTDYSFAKAKGEALVDQVRANPLLANTTAVRTRRVLSTSQYVAAFPSPLNVDALKQIAAAMHVGGS